MMLYDISLTVTPQSITWENAEHGLTLDWKSRIGADSPAHVSQLTIGSHVGTHLDAPYHFIDNSPTMESLDIQTLIGPVQVVEIYGRPELTSEDFEAAEIDRATERLIIKTDNTTRGLLHENQFYKDYVAIAPSGAEWLVAHAIRLVGVDYLSVGPYGNANIETHRILLGQGVVILETLVLDLIDAGFYNLIALPPKFSGMEGCPCRAVLWKE